MCACVLTNDLISFPILLNAVFPLHVVLSEKARYDLLLESIYDDELEHIVPAERWPRLVKGIGAVFDREVSQQYLD